MEKMNDKKNNQGKIKKWIRSISFVLAVVFVCTQTSFLSSAYFDRGTVKMSLGKTSVSLKQKESESVTVSLSPKSDKQLPGCGMPECPQSCGEKDCLTEDGECKCNGTTYQIYKAYAEVSSSNTSVATASYNNGVVTVKGISPGTATITVVGCLRQYTNSSAKTIQVTVSKSASKPSQGSDHDNSSSDKTDGGNSSSSSDNSAGNNGSQNNSSGNGKVTKVDSGSKSDASNQKNTGDSSSSAEQTDTDTDTDSSGDTDKKVMESDRGKITFLQIQAGKTGKSELEAIKGKKEYVDFQMKDGSDNVLYAWEFLGTDITKPMDMDYQIQTSSKAFDGCSYGTDADSLYIDFAHDGELPGKASVFLRLNNTFSDTDTLNLYYFDEKTGEISLVNEGLKPQAGYVTLSLTHCSKYILTTETFANAQEASDMSDLSSAEPEKAVQQPADKTDGISAAAVVIIIVVIAAAAVFGAVIFKKRKS